MGELIPPRKYGPASFLASEKAMLYVLVTACVAVIAACSFLVWRSLSPGSDPWQRSVTVEVDLRSPSPSVIPQVLVIPPPRTPSPAVTVTVTPSPARSTAASPSLTTVAASPAPRPVAVTSPKKPGKKVVFAPPAPSTAPPAPPSWPPAHTAPPQPPVVFQPPPPQPEPAQPPAISNGTVLTILGRIIHPKPDDGSAAVSDQASLVNMRTFQITKGNVQPDASFTFTGLEPGTRYCLSAWHHRRQAGSMNPGGQGGTFDAKVSWHQLVEASHYGTFTVYLNSQNADPYYCADTLLPNELVGRPSSMKRADLQPVQSHGYR